MHAYRRIIPTIIIALVTTSVAVADPPHGHWRGDRHFHRHVHPHWRDGHWYHGHHDGRLGWWWIAAGSWYYYPAPVYPYPAPVYSYPDPYLPSAVVIEPEPAPPREPIWYYCKSSRNYYPYVSICPEGWQAVPAEPRDSNVDDNDEPDEDE